jgi:hypothetical protein
MQCPERHILRLSPGSMRSSFVQQRAIAELILKVANVATPWIQRWNNGEGIQLISTGYSCVNGVNALLAAGKQRTWIIKSTICVCIYTYIYRYYIYIRTNIYIYIIYICTYTHLHTWVQQILPCRLSESEQSLWRSLMASNSHDSNACIFLSENTVYPQFDAIWRHPEGP